MDCGGGIVAAPGTPQLGTAARPQGGAAPAARQGVPLKRRGHVTEAEAVGGHGPAGHALHQAGGGAGLSSGHRHN